MPIFERKGLSFHYLDDGDCSGRPFVFQHGLGGDVSQPAGAFSPRRGAAEAHYQPSQPYLSTAARGAAARPRRPGRVPSSAGSPASARGKGKGSHRRRGRVALGQGRPRSRRSPGA